jgi:hypothetical protein
MQEKIFIIGFSLTFANHSTVDPVRQPPTQMWRLLWAGRVIFVHNTAISRSEFFTCGSYNKG